MLALIILINRVFLVLSRSLSGLLLQLIVSLRVIEFNLDLLYAS